MSEHNGSPFVVIAGTIGGVSVAIVGILAVLAEEHLDITPWIIGALAVMGMYLGYSAARKP
jgi:hypothetical protein